VRNNLLGTHHAALAAAQAGVPHFVLISTDKAVNPTNVMGASKRAAEMAVTSLARHHPATRFVTVRFGNVLGSSGSVIPKFKEQIARGGPVTVTHPDIIRYFMTIPEAARLVLQAATVGESGQVLVLDMGEPVRIVDLARQLIRLAGYQSDDIAIEFSGLRPGEKLYEELLADPEDTTATSLPGVRIARLEGDEGRVDALIAELNLSSAHGFETVMNDASLRARLRDVVVTYRPVGPPRAP
jgi:FlaA1/EpsC-like NDP-sugar epimerase